MCGCTSEDELQHVTEVHVLHAHLDEFKDNMGDYSEEKGENFHQDIRSLEEHYKLKDSTTKV